MISNPYYLGLFTLFVIVVYMMTVDSNVTHLILLLPKLIYIQLSRTFFIIKVYPRLRWDKFLLQRRLGKPSKRHLEMAKQIFEELKNENDK